MSTSSGRAAGLVPVALFMLFVSIMSAASPVLFVPGLVAARRSTPPQLFMLALLLFPAVVSVVTDLLLGVTVGWLLSGARPRWPRLAPVVDGLAVLLALLGGLLLLAAWAGCLPLLLRLPSFSFTYFYDGVLLPLDWVTALTSCRPAGPVAAILLAPDTAAAAEAYRSVVTDIWGLWRPNWGLGVFWLAAGLRLRRG